jgi:hypothetical protein
LTLLTCAPPQRRRDASARDLPHRCRRSLRS